MCVCGRVRLSSEFSQIRIRLKLDDIFAPPNFPPRWNMPPTVDMLTVVKDAATHTRRPLMMRWGLVPYWSKDPKIAFSTFNARADGIESKPAFRGAWKAGQRCLVVTDGFYEWRKSGKQPFAISVKEDMTVMAGLWELWRSPAGETVPTCTIITTEANEDMEPLHDRMPVILQDEAWPAWLGEASATPDQLREMLRPLPSGCLDMWPVDKRVGNVKHDDAELVQPLAQQEGLAV